jgi:hypothetical protein
MAAVSRLFRTLGLRRLAVSCAVASTVAVAAPAASSAYHFHAVKWPGGVVPYFNAARDQAWAVDRAVRAWNRSGARVHFVAVPRAQAKMVIEEDPHAVYCREGHASVGYQSRAHVVIFPAHGITKACNRYWATQLVAHELGHVLGLVHENRYCAAMNSRGNFHGGSKCEPKLRWEWRCRLLEPDDVAGVAAAYGGRPRPPLTPPTCPIYSAIAPPAHVSASPNEAGDSLTLSFTRPAEPVIPSFVAARAWRHGWSFALAASREPCGLLDVSAAVRSRWQVRAGEREEIQLRLPLHRTCFAVWAIDALGRPSDRPATITVAPT